MTTIGAAWLKQNKNEEYYYSLSFDDAIQPFTITSDKRITLKPNKNKVDNPNAPDFFIDVYKPDPAKSKKDLQDPNIKKAQEENMIPEDEEICF